MRTAIDLLAILGAFCVACSVGVVLVVATLPRRWTRADEPLEPSPERPRVRLLDPVYDHEDDDGWPAT